MDWKSRAHPIADVRDWNNENKLELQPDFQRNEVWSKAAQIMLIDTILKNIPIPKIYIKSLMKDDKTYRVVIDGQQRLTAILAYLNNKFKLSKPYTGEYEGLKFKDLPQKAKDTILTYNIDINEIVNPTEAEVRDLYARVNKYTVQLNKQELRRADFTGDFINLAEQLSDLEYFDDAKLFSSSQKRRMLDIEFIEELLCMLLEGEQDKKEAIDDFCERYEMFEQGKALVESDFLAVLQDIQMIFNEHLDISKTRFRQKSDFYSLFGVVLKAKKLGLTLKVEKISDLQKRLIILDKNIQPHSDDENMRTYAIHCTSDANSINSRVWRRDFLASYIMPAYVEGEDECI